MKHFISIALAGLGWMGSLYAAPAPVYPNFGVVNGPSNIDAISFENFGTFVFTNSTVNTNIGTPGASILTPVYIPFTTRDTLYFSNYNSGLIDITPGFRFDTGTSGTRRNASTFYNTGTIIGEDVPANPLGFIDTITTLAGPQPSQILIFATNIINTDKGSIAVGNDGLLQMTGTNLNLSNGSLSAGSVSESDPKNATGLETDDDEFFFFGFPYVNPPGVYDLFWGSDSDLEVTVAPDPGAGGTFDVTFLNLDYPFSPFTTRDNSQFLGLDFTAFSSNSFPGQSVFAFQSPIFQSSNFNFFDVNVVLVNTNLTDSNVTVSVGFNNIVNSNGIFFFGFNNGVEDIVRFSEAIPDAVTGKIVTNAVYFLDTGAELNGFGIETNASYVDGFGRPEGFQIDTSLPPEWAGALPANLPGFDPTSIDFFSFGSIYRAQIGRNPEVLDGTFTDLETNFATVALADVVNPTNEPGRLEIFGNNVNITNARFRAEGVATLVASNLTGVPLGKDWGNINADIGVTNGLLNISNIFPATFRRIRGDITAYAADGFSTNDAGGGFSNVINFHLLFLAPSLRGTFSSSVRNLALRSTNSTVVQDNLRIINNSYFSSSNLTLNAEVDLLQNAGSFFPTNAPNLKNLLLTTNALWNAENILDVGFNISKGHSVPFKRKYTVPSITNFGLMMATAPLLQASNIECDGTILASNAGSMVIEAFNLGLGLSSTNLTNFLIAGGNITLSAESIQATNSQIITGGTNGQGTGSLLLETSPTGQITDFITGVPATNSYVTNMWQVTDGFSLPIKPATGDLFGTEITTIASGFTVAQHTWAGVDLGATSDGFADNVVLGHLKLSRQNTNAALRFSGANAQNGMYVDFLELDTNSLSYTDYRNGLTIDPNLTIYFASCNADPEKLESAYPNRLVWVPGFVGPNSTVFVPYFNDTNGCFLNANVAISPDISFFPPVPNIDNQPFVLNNPTNVADLYSNCQSTATPAIFRDFLVGSNAASAVRVEISVVGDGTIAPVLKPKQLVLGKRYTLTAKPASGWIFSNWSGTGLPVDADRTAPVFKFQLENNLVLTASFSPRAFTLVKGAYHGLFQGPTNGLSASNSGAFTLTVDADGTASGRLFMGPATYVFTTKFSKEGAASASARHGSQSVNVNLQLDMTGVTGQVVGYVGQPDIVLRGDLAPHWTAKDPSPFAGRYTMIFTNAATNRAPGGDSSGSLAVSKLGVVSVAGKLSDGNAFGQSVPISKDGLWPFYSYASKGGDCVAGWIAFKNSEMDGPTIVETNILWSKASSTKDIYYPAGFTNTVEVISSPYANPGRNSSGLTLSDPVVILSGGDLARPLTNSVAQNGKAVYATNNLTLSINPAVGTFTGLYNSGDSSVRINGVVLQNQNSAMGFFLGTSGKSDAVLLRSR